MVNDDINTIRIGNLSVGIMGLKAVMEEMAGKYRKRPDQEIRDQLLNCLGKNNYIPEKARDDYGRAFLREFNKFLGKPFEEEKRQGIEVKVLGPGCAQCNRLEQELMQVMAETGIMADIEHVRNIKEIGRYGVMGTPALIINGKVKSVGSVPLKSKMIAWLKEAQGVAHNA